MTKENIRPWGEYHVVAKTKTFIVRPNQKLSLQYHNHREEFWKILSGSGKVTIGDNVYDAKAGDTFIIHIGEKHRLESGPEGLEFMEVATGEVDENDIVRIEDNYGRIEQNQDSRPIVINSGYFDPIHIGHIECLYLSKDLIPNAKLVVILNNDEQAKLKKGQPFMSQEERKKILESIECVDEVIISVDKDKSVCESIKTIAEKYKGRKIIFAKGGDRFSYEIPEAKVCKDYNIQIIDSVGKKIQSSSNLTGLKEIRNE